MATGYVLTHSAAEIDQKLDQIDTLTEQVANKAPMYMYSTVDLSAGSSPLATGVLYFVYEE